VSPSPTVDGRDADDFLEAALERAPHYVPEWESTDDDVGTALLRLHAELAGDVADRADRLLEKHRAAFVETLGFERSPPAPSRLPVSVAVTPSASGNVPIPAGTRVTATGLDGAERTFEVDEDNGFEATPARLRSVFSVDPRLDAIYDHGSGVPADDDGPTAPFSPFVGENRQEHALYLAADDLLTVAPGAHLRVLLDTPSPQELFRDCLTWEYYGVETDDVGEERTGWHRLGSRGGAGACQYSTRDAARRLAGVVARRTEYDVRDADDGARESCLVAVVARLREWFDDPNETTDRAVADALLPSEATAADRSVVSGALRSLSDPRLDRATTDAYLPTVTLEFTVRGEPVPTTVADVESRWIRARVPSAGLLGDLSSVVVANPSFRVSTRGSALRGGIRPDRLLHGVAPVAVEERTSFRPFGPTPSPEDAFYVASDEAFAKRGERITLGFAYADGDETGDRGLTSERPALSWEYWDGVGWARIPGVDDGTESLRTAGTVTFTVPTDLAPTSVAGREHHWIRVRLVDGQYVRTTYRVVDEEVRAETTGSPPRYGDVRVTYNSRTAASHVVTQNGFERVPRPAPGAFRPFSEVPDAVQTLYLGFDAPLSDGPLSVLFDVGAREYPPEFRPRLAWERCVDAARDEWEAVDAVDGTAGLTELGTVRFEFAEPTRASVRFGRERYWLRGRLVSAAFAVTDRPLLVLPRAGRSGRGGPGGGIVTPERTGDRLVAGDRTAGRATPSPTLGGVYTNTGWARDVRTVDDELLGSSDGSAKQSFEVGSPPAIEEQVWVDESATLSAGGRADLTAARPDDVESVLGPDGRVRKFWVRWTRVPTFLGSGAADRHYTLDAVAGTVRFGDGVAGRIPPRGSENVRATYRTGGGTAGNVSAGSVTGLTSAVPFVESVTNPAPADGGADGESTDAVLDRAPGAIRDRGRAVAAADLERVARATSPKVARAKCLPGVGPDGEPRPGWVTLVVVPDARGGRPVPSRELRRQVRDALANHVPASLVAPGRERLLVRGPDFVTVAVEATVAGAGAESLSSLEREVTARLGAFLDPLSGGPGGEGWWFGELPSLSEVYAMLERLDGVDHVERLSVTYRGSERDVTVTEGEPLPTVGPDVLASGGAHDVTATGDR
jgi:hypothetical protein